MSKTWFTVRTQDSEWRLNLAIAENVKFHGDLADVYYPSPDGCTNLFRISGETDIARIRRALDALEIGHE